MPFFTIKYGTASVSVAVYSSYIITHMQIALSSSRPKLEEMEVGSKT